MGASVVGTVPSVALVDPDPVNSVVLVAAAAVLIPEPLLPDEQATNKNRAARERIDVGRTRTTSDPTVPLTFRAFGARSLHDNAYGSPHDDAP